MSSQKRKQESKSRNTTRRKGHHLLHHIQNDPDMTILQEAVMVAIAPGLHHGIHIRVEEVHRGVVVVAVVVVLGAVVEVHPIIKAMVVLRIRVEVTLDTGAVDLAVTETAIETVMGTEVIHHRRLEILAITILHQCVQAEEVMGHRIPGALWNLHRLTIMTDMHHLHHRIVMIGARLPHLMDTHLLLPEEEVVVVDIMVETMVVTEVALHLLLLHHIITPRGGTEHLETIFC